MKYIKLFETEKEYNNFLGGVEFITPHISYTRENKNVLFKPREIAEKGKIITFYIKDSADDTIYQFECEEGMTWEDFVNSEYNPTTGICINFKVLNPFICFYHVLADIDTVEVMFDYSNDIHNINVYKNELIINEHIYGMYI